uniref:Uncharacterized protein n=1 Tax=Rhizophora mucronata TaxID=61149 RepID=A0A2P2PRE0_RHIMU
MFSFKQHFLLIFLLFLCFVSLPCLLTYEGKKKNLENVVQDLHLSEF